MLACLSRITEVCLFKNNTYLFVPEETCFGFVLGTFVLDATLPVANCIESEHPAAVTAAFGVRFVCSLTASAGFYCHW